jgi:hypothetical protein
MPNGRWDSVCFMAVSVPLAQYFDCQRMMISDEDGCFLGYCAV